jgi:hypothetical protein
MSRRCITAWNSLPVIVDLRGVLQVNEGVRERENSDTLEWIQLHVNCRALSDKITFNAITNLLGPRRCLYYGPLNKVTSEREVDQYSVNAAAKT